MSGNKMIIEIEPQAIKMTTVRDGVASTKHTNLRAVQEVLTKDKRIETPLLPSQWGVQKYVKSNDRELYLISTPPHIREVLYNFREDGNNETRKYKVALPGFLWAFIFDNRAGQEQRVYRHGCVYAIKNPILSMRDPLYKFPFSNCDDRWLCWGDSPPAPFASSKGLISVPDLFIGMRFNNHLDHNRYRRFTHTRAGREVELFKTSHMFEYLAEKQKEAEAQGKDSEFKYDSLVPLDMTVNDAFERFMREFMN